MEAVLALAKELGCTPEGLDAVRKKKAEARGAFKKKLFLINVDEG